jgi:hypothetical protein
MSFHVHIDAQELDKRFEHYLTHALGFWHSDFSGHPEGIEHYEPPHHLTQKVATSKEFKELFDRVVENAKAPQAMTGYIEGEFIALDQDLPQRPFDPAVPVPFSLQRRFLPAGQFRETEVHVTLDRDRSHPQLLGNLLEMGVLRRVFAQILRHSGNLHRSGFACSHRCRPAHTRKLPGTNRGRRRM